MKYFSFLSFLFMSNLFYLLSQYKADGMIFRKESAFLQRFPNVPNSLRGSDGLAIWSCR